MIRFVFKPALLASLVALFMLSSTLEAHSQIKKYRVNYKDEGFSPIIEGAVLLPSNTFSSAYDINVIMGYQINPYLYAGVGASLDAYDSDLFLPLFADIRYFFLPQQFSPFLYLDAGYALPLDIDERLSGGPVVNPGFGIRYWMTRTCAANFSLGYRYHSMPFDQVNDDGSITAQPNYIQSFSIRFGLQF